MLVFKFKRILIRLLCLEHAMAFVELVPGEWVQTLYSQSDVRSGKVYWQQWGHHVFSSLSSVPSGPPWNVTITNRSKNELTVSWRAPDQSLQTDELTGYKVCYSDKAGSSNPNCSQENDQSYTIVIKNLRPATKYFVTVGAGTSGGYGPNSAEISKITSGGKTISD
jgi:hypothetical protein